jgi:hypothetical protein
MASRQVSQHTPPLLPARRHHGKHPLHEPAPRLAVCPPTDPAPDPGMPQGALGRVVRRLDALDPREGPQT